MMILVFLSLFSLSAAASGTSEVCAKVITAGTGQFLANPERASHCTVVTVGTQEDDCQSLAYVFDVGFGSGFRLSSALDDDYSIDALFISHPHTDHFADVAYAGTRNEKMAAPGTYSALPVYHPEGIVNTKEGPIDLQEVLASHLNGLLDRASVYGTEFEFHQHGTPLDPEILLTNEEFGVTIKAVQVSHSNLPSVAWNVVVEGVGHVVISGDVDNKDVESTQQMAKFYQDGPVDVLVHEIVSERFVPIGLSSHSHGPAIAARAEALEAELVVLTHLIPGPCFPDLGPVLGPFGAVPFVTPEDFATEVTSKTTTELSVYTASDLDVIYLTGEIVPSNIGDHQCDIGNDDDDDDDDDSDASSDLI